jgi:hypothetical protein
VTVNPAVTATSLPEGRPVFQSGTTDENTESFTPSLRSKPVVWPYDGATGRSVLTGRHSTGVILPG